MCQLLLEDLVINKTDKVPDYEVFATLKTNELF